MVIAKFRLWSREERASTWRKPTPEQIAKGAMPHGPEAEPRIALKFSAVQDAIFGPYTPAGEAHMTVVESAGKHFTLGEEYLVAYVSKAEYEAGQRTFTLPEGLTKSE